MVRSSTPHLRNRATLHWKGLVFTTGLLIGIVVVVWAAFVGAGQTLRSHRYEDDFLVPRQWSLVGNRIENDSFDFGTLVDCGLTGLFDHHCETQHIQWDSDAEPTAEQAVVLLTSAGWMDVSASGCGEASEASQNVQGGRVTYCTVVGAQDAYKAELRLITHRGGTTAKFEIRMVIDRS